MIQSSPAAPPRDDLGANAWAAPVVGQWKPRGGMQPGVFLCKDQGPMQMNTESQKMQAASIVLAPGTGVPVSVPVFDPRPPENEAAVNPPAEIVHARRRRWPAIALLCVLAAVGGTAAAWYLSGPHYTAVVRFIIPFAEESILVKDGAPSESNYALRQRTEAQIITGYNVLLSALMRRDSPNVPEFSRLPLEERLPYLKSCVSVAFPQDAEIMELRVRCRDRQAAIDFANEISNTYLEEHQQKLLIARESFFKSLREYLEEYKEQYRQRQDDLNRLEQLVNPAEQEQTPEEKTYERQIETHLALVQSLHNEILQVELKLKMLELRSGAEFEVTDEENQLHLQEPITESERREWEIRKRMALSNESPDVLHVKLQAIREILKEKESNPPTAPVSLSAGRNMTRSASTLAIARHETAIAQYKMETVEHQLIRMEFLQREALARGNMFGIRKLDEKAHYVEPERSSLWQGLMQAAGRAAAVLSDPLQ